MADYYPLISRAVAGLERNTGENRRSLYERARNALLDQLRSVTPALSETDITRERLALEEAIRKVESDVARRMREETPRPSERGAPRPRPPQDIAPPAAPPSGSPAPTGEDEPPPPPPPLESRPAFGRIVGRPEVTAADLRRFQRRAPVADNKAPEPVTSEPAPVFAPAQAELELGSTALAEPPEAPEPADLAESPQPPEPEPEEPAPVEVKERKPLRFPGFGLMGRKRSEPDPAETELDPITPDTEVEPEEAPALAGRELAATRALEPPLMMDGARPRPVALRRPAPVAKKAEGGGTLKRLFDSSIATVAIAALVICLVGGALFWQRNAIKAGFASLFSIAHGPATTQASHDNTPARSKIPDRVGQSTSQQPAEQPRSAQAIPAASRVVLYEEDPSDTNGSGKHYEGTVTWSLENIAAGPGQPMDKAIRGDIVIPERNMTATFTIRRNTDKDLPASHTVSIVFTLPPDFVHGGIQEIRALLMKQTEPARGVQLAGLSVKVTTGFFLIGLSANEGDIQRNIQLLKERGWFDIAIGYTDNRRAIMAVEKGPQGDRVFADAFAAWGQ
jgi:hypothetical protein